MEHPDDADGFAGFDAERHNVLDLEVHRVADVVSRVLGRGVAAGHPDRRGHPPAGDGSALPNEFRTNAIAKNLDAFHAAFGVTDQDGMWMAPQERVSIW